MFFFYAFVDTFFLTDCGQPTEIQNGMIEKSNDGNPYGINPEEIAYYRDNHPQAAQYTCHQFYSMPPEAAIEVKCNKETFMFEPPAPECLPGSFSTYFDSFYN